MIILNTDKLLEIFVFSDDFMIEFQPFIRQKLIGRPKWRGKMSKSELMSIVIFFHLSGIRCFRWYYEMIVKKHLQQDFPYLYTYENFVSHMPAIQLELFFFLHYFCLSEPSEANYIDSKPLEVCHIKREKQHRVFKALASKGKTSKGWFFGFKLHLICNQQGGLVRLWLSSGHVADNNADLLKTFLDGFQASLYGDKGYITKLKDSLHQKGCLLITKLRKNMKQQDLTAPQQYYLNKRTLIETVFDQLVNICQIEHSRHRSPVNFLVNLWAGLIAYTFKDQKPAIRAFDRKDIQCQNIVLLQDFCQ